MNSIIIKMIEEDARKELSQEKHRIEVDKYKIKLKNKKTIWDRLFPYKLIIIRKG